MKMIKIFILTYASPSDLDQNLTSLFNSYVDPREIDVHIINNHSTKFELNDRFKDKVTVHHQSLRADWGCGSPGRDWNQALVLGFKDLKDPACEQIILCQDDCVWHQDWRPKLREVHKKYTLYQCSWGDCFLSILPDAIKTIGLFDESMCSLGYYEADFLLRAWLFNRDKTTINDFYHYRMLNITTTVATRIDRKPGDARGYRYQDHSAKVFSTKWPGVEANGWYHSLFRNPPTGPATPVFMNYPYFEYDVEDLEKKGFVVR